MSPGLKWRSSDLSSLSEHLTVTNCLQPCRRSSWLPGRSWKHLPLFFSAAFLVLPFPFAFMPPIFFFFFLWNVLTVVTVFLQPSSYWVMMWKWSGGYSFFIFVFCLKLWLLLIIIWPKRFHCIVCCEKSFILQQRRQWRSIAWLLTTTFALQQMAHFGFCLTQEILVSDTILLKLVLLFFFNRSNLWKGIWSNH